MTYRLWTTWCAILFVAFPAHSEKPGNNLWNDLAAKRASLTGAHQEFDVSRTFTLESSTQASKWQLTVDMAAGHWRERSTSGSSDSLRIFDGENLFRMEEGGNEFEREKRRPKDKDPTPEIYQIDADWGMAVEKDHRPCGYTQSDHLCVVLEAPLKRMVYANQHERLGGTVQFLIDTETGLALSRRSLEVISGGTPRYQADITFSLKRMSLGNSANADLFKLPSSSMVEVKALPKWNAARIGKQLAGKAAPPLVAIDIAGKPIDLADLKGRVVLLDFWTTWCPPCRADAPALEKLYRKYGAQDLAIIGISVSEDRAVVAKFLKENPHIFPTVLTTENEMPKPYQIGALPTYIVIERDGTVASAAEGDQGFKDLRKLLKKAGLEAE